jgi:hypothetical protein
MTPAAREREVQHLRQVINAAKVVVALTAAIAATFVAGTLQENEKPTWWDHASALLMAITLIISFWLITQPVPPRSEIDEATFDNLRDHARWTHSLVQVQVLLSGLSCVTATLGLLWPYTWPPGHWPGR